MSAEGNLTISWYLPEIARISGTANARGGENLFRPRALSYWLEFVPSLFALVVVEVLFVEVQIVAV